MEMRTLGVSAVLLSAVALLSGCGSEAGEPSHDNAEPVGHSTQSVFHGQHVLLKCDQGPCTGWNGGACIYADPSTLHLGWPQLRIWACAGLEGDMRFRWIVEDTPGDLHWRLRNQHLFYWGNVNQYLSPAAQQAGWDTAVTRPASQDVGQMAWHGHPEYVPGISVTQEWLHGRCLTVRNGQLALNQPIDVGPCPSPNWWGIDFKWVQAP